MVVPLTLFLQREPAWDVVQLGSVGQVNKYLGANTVIRIMWMMYI